MILKIRRSVKLNMFLQISVRILWFYYNFATSSNQYVGIQ